MPNKLMNTFSVTLFRRSSNPRVWFSWQQHPTLRKPKLKVSAVSQALLQKSGSRTLLENKICKMFYLDSYFFYQPDCVFLKVRFQFPIGVELSRVLLQSFVWCIGFWPSYIAVWIPDCCRPEHFFSYIKQLVHNVSDISW